jgi:hypothetical protein
MFTTDHFEGSFEGYDTDVRFDEATSEWVTSAMGIEARHQSQSQSLNDFNAKFYEAVSRGEVIPSMGN